MLLAALDDLDNQTLFCELGIDLYMAWSILLDQNRPKAKAKEISDAKRNYINHRRKCKICPEWREEFNGKAS